MTHFEDEWLELVKQYNEAQLVAYIEGLEDRITGTQQQIRYLKQILRRKTRNKNLRENGPRSGT